MLTTPTVMDLDEARAVRERASAKFIEVGVPWYPGFKAHLRFIPGFNDLHTRGGQSRGQHGMDIDFSITGPLGAVSCALQTFWTPLGKVDVDEGGYAHNLVHCGGWEPGTSKEVFAPTGRVLAVHWLTQIDGNGGEDPEDCIYLGGRKCWVDISYTASDPVMVDFITFGHDKVFEHLKGWYDRTAAQQLAEAFGEATS